MTERICFTIQVLAVLVVLFCAYLDYQIRLGQFHISSYAMTVYAISTIVVLLSVDKVKRDEYYWWCDVAILYAFSFPLFDSLKVTDIKYYFFAALAAFIVVVGKYLYLKSRAGEPY